MGRGLGGTDAYEQGDDNELPEHPAYVSDFYLDAFEVTVFRFMAFADEYPASLPQEGAGAHPKIPGSGWRSEWNAKMPVTRKKLDEYLDCNNAPQGFPTWSTWDATPWPYGDAPLNCVTWYIAFAFCAWEGGRLPTEAEWEYAAAGGDEDRKYPWGDVEPMWPAWKQACSSPNCILQTPHPASLSRWGNFNLAGSVGEFVLDGMLAYTMDPCVDCARGLGDPVEVVTRGGGWTTYFPGFRAASRDGRGPLSSGPGYGFRCARSP